MRWLLVSLLLVVARPACPSFILPDCDDLPAVDLDGPPDGLGLKVPQRNACDLNTPVAYSFKKANKLGCATSRCVLGMTTTHITGGSPAAGASCLTCATVDGTRCTSLAWVDCTIVGPTTTTTSTTTTSTAASTTSVITSTSTTTTLAFLAIDDFERGTLGANWDESGTESETCEITGSSDIIATNAGGSPYSGRCSDMWMDGAPTTTASYACARFSFIGDEGGVCVAMSSALGGSEVCCVASSDDVSGIPAHNGWSNYEFFEGSFFGHEEQSTPVFAAGDWIGIERLNADDYRCYRSTNGTSWTALGSVLTTTDLPDPGRVGIAIISNDFNGKTTFELWEGGDGTLPTGRACGTPP